MPAKRAILGRTAAIVFNACLLWGQTRVDLRNQTRNVDYSGAPETLPFSMGTNLPSTCRTGSAYVKTDGGGNGTVYLCNTTNIWKPLGSALLASGLDDLRVKASTAQQLVIGDLCSESASCNVSVGATSYRITAPATAALSGNTASSIGAKAYLSAAGLIYIEYESTVGSITINCVNCMALAVPAPHFPADSLPLAEISIIASGGSPQWSTITDRREFLKAPSISAVTAAAAGGVTMTCASGACQAAVDGSYTATQPGTNDFSGNNRFGAGVEGLDNTIANDTTTGTGNGLLARWTAGKAIKTAGPSDDGIIGLVISGGGVTGSARIRHRGFGDCVFDGAATAGNYVQPSQVANGQCRDAGVDRPLSGSVIGRVITTGSGSQRIWINLEEPPATAAIADVKTNQQVAVGTGPTWYVLSTSTVPVLRGSSCLQWKAWLTSVSATAPVAVRIRLGATVLGTASLTAAGSLEGMVCNGGVVTTQWGSFTYLENGGSTQTSQTLAEDTGISKTLTMEVQSAASGVIRLDNYILTMVR